MGGKKRRLEITFDDAARKEYLTGFRKRKLERRRHGLAMQAMKDRREHLETRKELRESRSQARRAIDPDVNGAKGAGKEEDGGPASAEGGGGDAGGSGAPAQDAEEMLFDDAGTRDMFGDFVTVTTVEGLVHDGDSEDEGELDRRERERAAAGRKRGLERKKSGLDTRDDQQRRALSLDAFKKKLKQLPMRKRKNAKAKRMTEAAPARGGGKRKGKRR